MDTLFVALEHLGSTDGNQQHYKAAARGLHRASKYGLAAARATQRHLPLDRFFGGLVSAYPDPDRRPSIPPSLLLVAYPSVTSLSVDIQQLAAVSSDSEQLLAAVAGKLKFLRVTQRSGSYRLDMFHPPGVPFPDPSDAQQQALGRLLRASERVEQVEILCRISKPWLVLDPDSSSLSTATAPSLPLSSWKSYQVPHTLLTSWATQQQLQQPGRALSDVGLAYAGDIQDFTGLAAVRGLRALRLGTSKVSSPTGLTSLTSVTSLQLRGTAAVTQAALGLTGLRRLDLGDPKEVLWMPEPPMQMPSSVASLKQLTTLKMAGVEVPAALGTWLPSLVELAVECGTLQAALPSLTRLTSLSVRTTLRVQSIALALPSSLTRLKALYMEPGDSDSITEIRHLVGLEVLTACLAAGGDATAAAAAGATLADLQPLTGLRRLQLHVKDKAFAPQLTVLGGLQGLTHFSIVCDAAGPTPEGLAWPLSVPLLALQELRIWGYTGACGLAAMSHWVVQHTALTQLQVGAVYISSYGDESMMEFGGFMHAQDMSQPLAILPSGLVQLSALRVLQLRMGPRFCELPSWLSVLRRLEVLDLWGTGVVSEQPVLAQMPSLRSVIPPAAASRVILFGAATPLHFGNTDFKWLWV
jgi:hypothetical protein